MKEVKSFYNKYQYPKIKTYTNRQKKRHNKLLTKIFSYTKLDLKDLKGKKVLDVGCGTGEKSIFFAKNGAKVTSVDFSKKQLEVLRENAKKENVLNKIKIIEHDIEKNKLNIGKFDIVFCIGVLHHTKSAYQSFLNILPTFKKNTIVVLALYHKFIRLRYRINRFLLHLYSKDFKKLENFLFNSRLTKNIRKAPKNSLYDRYIIPYESYHTLSKVKKWFRENNIEFIDSSKNVKGIEFLKIFKKKSLFFVTGVKK